MLTDAELDSLRLEPTVYDPAWTEIFTQAKEANHLKAELAAAREELAGLQANFTEASEDVRRLVHSNAELRAAIRDADRSWSFSDGQAHTHSWHDKQDWRARHAASLSPAPQEGGGDG